MKVVPLFGRYEDISLDPMEELLREAYLEDEDLEDDQEFFHRQERRKDIVLETHYPDQSMHVLDKQLKNLRSSLERLRFYLGDIDNHIPDKNL